MDTAPATCIVVPTLGRELRWLTRCLDSIASQSRPVLMRVVSTDQRIQDLARKFGAEFILQVDKGLSPAINLGLRDLPEYIRYVSWLGDDDLLAPGAIAAAEEALACAPGAPFVFGRIRYIDEADRTKCVIRPGRWAVEYSKRGRNFVGQPGSLIRREAFERVNGVDEGLRNSMDQDLFLRLSGTGSPEYLNRELAAWRVHPDSISSTKGIADESRQVGTAYRRKQGPFLESLFWLIFKVSDRVLLSAHPRVPKPRIPLRNGQPYTRPVQSPTSDE